MLKEIELIVSQKESSNSLQDVEVQPDVTPAAAADDQDEKIDRILDKMLVVTSKVMIEEFMSNDDLYRQKYPRINQASNESLTPADKIVLD